MFDNDSPSRLPRAGRRSGRWQRRNSSEERKICHWLDGLEHSEPNTWPGQDASTSNTDASRPPSRASQDGAQNAGNSDAGGETSSFQPPTLDSRRGTTRRALASPITSDAFCTDYVTSCSDDLILSHSCSSTAVRSSGAHGESSGISTSHNGKHAGRTISGWTSDTTRLLATGFQRLGPKSVTSSHMSGTTLVPSSASSSSPQLDWASYPSPHDGRADHLSSSASCGHSRRELSQPSHTSVASTTVFDSADSLTTTSVISRHRLAYHRKVDTKAAPPSGDQDLFLYIPTMLRPLPPLHAPSLGFYRLRSAGSDASSSSAQSEGQVDRAQTDCLFDTIREALTTPL
ncbi:uncharacterized protein C8Q71DRAFT_788457 [Rhodofomes roseus]|uniref:Uncharacterized protein n=1 Tax=Rhodofomes roseus TaxID=34475 RepID=A0ABQ8K085_9APHY|nr:uncharacterized protein C8Q71DRAFT_788457 [Rhodofomes roseus]KAH9830060.1 hypothetical protein C8Q71DRAFT_788457 [Rhodofomes roseus]